jgi:nitrile hydratase accessory protein
VAPWRTVSDQPEVTRSLAAAEGPAAPPRSNGELVFAAPWESRSFGMAVALAEAGRVEWERFRQRLIAEIGAWEREHGGEEGERWSYYACWLASLERLLVEDRLLEEEEILARAALLEQADDHDHDHDHGHAHGHDHDHAHGLDHDHAQGHGERSEDGHGHDRGEDRAGRRA